jgi:hypothetical protein
MELIVALVILLVVVVIAAAIVEACGLPPKVALAIRLLIGVIALVRLLHLLGVY